MSVLAASNITIEQSADRASDKRRRRPSAAQRAMTARRSQAMSRARREMDRNRPQGGHWAEPNAYCASYYT